MEIPKFSSALVLNITKKKEKKKEIKIKFEDYVQ